MKILSIAWKDVRIRLRDRKGFLMLIIMPIVLTMILGAALGGVFNEDQNSLPSMTIAIYNGDTGQMGKILVEDVFQGADLKSYVTVQIQNSEEEVNRSVQDGKAQTGIVIPKGFSDDVMASKSTKVTVVEDPGKKTIGQIVQSIVTSYTDRVSTTTSTTKDVMTDLSKAVPVVSASPAAFGKIVPQIIDELKQAAENPNVSVLEQPIGEKSVSAKQYYAAAMAAMFLLFNATIGAKSILGERSNETLARMMSTPTSKVSILLGKFVGTLLFAIVQFGVLLAATRWFLGISWGEHVWQTIAIGIVYSIAVSGLSMAVASLVSTEQTADVLSNVGIQVLSVLGGSMVPLAVFPVLMRKIALITPNTWALTSFLDIMTGTTWQALLLPISVLMAIGAATLSIGTWRLSAR